MEGCFMFQWGGVVFQMGGGGRVGGFISHNDKAIILQCIFKTLKSKYRPAA